MKKNMWILMGTALIMMIGSFAFLLAVSANQSVQTTQPDLLKGENTFRAVCFKALTQFEHLYADKQIPDWTSPQNKLIYFHVETKDGSTLISRIDFKLSFDAEGTTYLQSVSVSDGKAISHIGSSPSLNEDTPYVSLHNFLSCIDGINFNDLISRKPKADKYGFDYINVSDTFPPNSGDTQRFLVNETGIKDGNISNALTLDRFVPVISFIGAIKSAPDVYHDDSGLEVYLNNLPG